MTDNYLGIENIKEAGYMRGTEANPYNNINNTKQTITFNYNKDGNVHRFALSAIKSKLLERKRDSFGILYTVTYYP